MPMTTLREQYIERLIREFFLKKGSGFVLKGESVHTAKRRTEPPLEDQHRRPEGAGVPRRGRGVSRS